MSIACEEGYVELLCHKAVVETFKTDKYIFLYFFLIWRKKNYLGNNLFSNSTAFVLISDTASLAPSKIGAIRKIINICKWQELFKLKF
jgi:hypothetical protein